MMAELIAPIDTPHTQSRLHAVLMQGLIDARLIGAERAAALKHQSHAIASVGPASCGMWKSQCLAFARPLLSPMP